MTPELDTTPPPALLTSLQSSLLVVVFFPKKKKKKKKKKAKLRRLGNGCEMVLAGLELAQSLVCALVVGQHTLAAQHAAVRLLALLLEGFGRVQLDGLWL